MGIKTTTIRTGMYREKRRSFDLREGLTEPEEKALFRDMNAMTIPRRDHLAIERERIAQRLADAGLPHPSPRGRYTIPGTGEGGFAWYVKHVCGEDEPEHFAARAIEEIDSLLLYVGREGVDPWMCIHMAIQLGEILAEARLKEWEPFALNDHRRKERSTPALKHANREAGAAAEQEHSRWRDCAAKIWADHSKLSTTTVAKRVLTKLKPLYPYDAEAPDRRPIKAASIADVISHLKPKKVPEPF